MACTIKVFMKNEEKEKPIIGVPKINREYVKTATKSDGTKMVFINKDHGIKRGFMSKMDFKTTHPLHPSFCVITIPIEIVQK